MTLRVGEQSPLLRSVRMRSVSVAAAKRSIRNRSPWCIQPSIFGPPSRTADKAALTRYTEISLAAAYGPFRTVGEASVLNRVGVGCPRPAVGQPAADD
jgi:hypothetical protein